MIWTWGGISHYISAVTPDPVLKHPCPITSEACIPGSRRGESEKLILLKYWCFTPAQPVPEGRGFDSSLCSVFMICLHHLAGIYAVCCPQQVVVVAFYYCVHISKQIDLGCSAGFCSVIKLQAHEQFEEPKLEAVRENNVELVQDILKELSPIAQSSQAANELVRILKEPHFQVRAYCGSQASVWCLVNVTLSINDAYWAYTHCKHGLSWSPADRPALQWPQQPDLSIASHVKYSNVETISYHRLHYHLFFFLTCSLSWKLTTLWLPKTMRPLPPAPVRSWMQLWITNLFPQTQSGWLAFAKCPASTWWVCTINGLVCISSPHFHLQREPEGPVWWLRVDLNVATAERCESCTVKLAHTLWALWLLHLNQTCVYREWRSEWKTASWWLPGSSTVAWLISKVCSM